VSTVLSISKTRFQFSSAPKVAVPQSISPFESEMNPSKVISILKINFLTELAPVLGVDAS
jgi:hypothetical protein